VVGHEGVGKELAERDYLGKEKKCRHHDSRKQDLERGGGGRGRREKAYYGLFVGLACDEKTPQKRGGGRGKREKKVPPKGDEAAMFTGKKMTASNIGENRPKKNGRGNAVKKWS